MKKTALPRSRIRPDLRTVIATLCVLACCMPAAAQTLDGQYDFYLRNFCGNMNFAKVNGNVPATEAGEHLRDFCSSQVTTQGVSTSTASGGGTWSAAGQEVQTAGAAERRRREAPGSGAEPRATELTKLGQASVFASLDYQHERQTTTVYEPGRVSRAVDALLGIDRRFGNQGVLGAALHVERLDGDIDTGGDFRGTTAGLWAYGSWWPDDNLFVDVALNVEGGSLDLQRIVSREVVAIGGAVTYQPPPAPVDSKPHRFAFSWDWRAGYDLSYAGFTGGPRLGFSVKNSRLRDYTETGDTPMALHFATRRVTSLQSVAGLRLGWALPIPGIAIVPQLNVDWAHEYANDQQLLHANFAEDLRAEPTELRFLSNAPDRSWRVYRASIAVNFHRLAAFVTYQETSGNSLIDRYQASLGVRLEL